MNPIRQMHRRVGLRLRPMKDATGHERKGSYASLKAVPAAKARHGPAVSRTRRKREAARSRAEEGQS